MSATQLMMLAISASMFLVVFSLGLDTTFAGVTYLFRRPALLRVLVELRTQRVNLYLALGGDFGTAVPTPAESSHTP